MTTHRPTTPTQLSLPFPNPPPSEPRTAAHDEVILLLAQLLLSATRARHTAAEDDREPR